MARSILVGAVGFAIVSLAGFAPWAIAGKALHRAVGELGLYAACALVFMGLSGLFLHRLIIGPGALLRFYLLFSLAFGAYAVGWTFGWVALRGNVGSTVGLLLGTGLMAWILVRAFEAPEVFLRVLAALFLLNAAGYFAGGWVEAAMARIRGNAMFGLELSRSTRMSLAMLSWGLCYGIGFGAGLGLAFYWCQAKTRLLLSARSD